MAIGTAMSEKIRILRIQPSRRWAECWLSCEPVEITSGELFRGGVDGKLQIRRMEYAHEGRGYFTVGGPQLRSGMRAPIASGE
jgi:hypothetical protein